MSLSTNELEKKKTEHSIQVAKSVISEVEVKVYESELQIERLNEQKKVQEDRISSLKTRLKELGE